MCKRDDVPLYVSETADVTVYCGEECQRVGVHMPGNDELLAAARLLLNQGYCVVRVYTDEETVDRHQSLQEALYQMPEYLPGAKKLVGGGFGALGNSSSFHLPIVRQMRREAQQVAARLFKTYIEERGVPEMRLEQLVDRVRVLRTGAEITSELWHRDQTPRKANPAVTERDLIFGGWISLNGTQRFSAIKGSHNDPIAAANANKGFAPLTKEESERYSADKQRALEAGEAWYIEVPPGHMLIFQQEMIHEVVGGKHKGEDQLRLFTGWRLTPSTTSFIKNPREFFDEQGITNIKSDQTPDMYPDRPWSSSTATRLGLAKWSAETFQPYVLEQRSVQSGKAKGETHTLVPKHMPSLYELSLKRTAWRVMQEMQQRLDAQQTDAFQDEEKQTAFEAVQVIATMPPAKWATLHVFKKPSAGELVWETDYFEVPLYERMLFPAYNQDDRLILTPLRLV